jgi:hypothetical protein
MSRAWALKSTLWSNAIGPWIAFLCFACVQLFVAAGACAQSVGDQWVTLATATVDARTGHASIDLSKAKGAFRAVRIAVRSSAVALRNIELKYGDGTSLKERRALILRPNAPTRPIGSSSEDVFLDRIELTFRSVAGELDRATIAIEGLQSPQGAVAARTPSSPSRETEAKRRTEEEAARSVDSIEAKPPKPAVSEPAAQRPVRSTPDSWDVVPVFYGTDRNRAVSGTPNIYGTERARRLEVGRALVTVPKGHEVPNLERPWVYRLPFTQIVLAGGREDPKQHFTIMEVNPLTKEDFLRLVRERLGPSERYKDHALVFVHGFDSSFENALSYGPNCLRHEV